MARFRLTFRCILWTPLLVLLWGPQAVRGQGADAAAPAADEGCVTGDCHAGLGRAEFVHGPVGALVCSACHVETGQRHRDGRTELVVEPSRLCYFCHEGKHTAFALPVQHQPVAKGECIGCHDPHQSDYRYQLRARADTLCYGCHPDQVSGRAFVHGPVATGNCQVCHDPHASEFPRLLPAPGSDACLECHQEKVRDLALTHVHPPVTEDCTACHDPHASDVRYQLNEGAPTLCYECHADVEQDVAASVDHPPAERGECLACHEAHASARPRLLRRPGTDLCFSCHETEGREVLTARNRHGPVIQGDCTACHNPHGAANPFVLRQYFPEAFYNPFDTARYALCFNCHNRDIALEPETKTLTDFRDGKRNLHYVHVNKKVKGRSCKACHGVHSSNQAKHIRTSVPFGQSWSYPIRYTKLEDGGRCVVGCHKPREYHHD